MGAVDETIDPTLNQLADHRLDGDDHSGGTRHVIEQHEPGSLADGLDDCLDEAFGRLTRKR